MRSDINTVIKRTLLNLREKGIIATPEEYSKEFAAVAKGLKIETEKSKKFNDFIEKLDERDKLEIQKRDIKTTEELLFFFLKRLNKNNTIHLSELISSSLNPSINVEFNEDLEKFKEKIENTPSLLFEKNIQDEIQKFINQRFTLDGSLIKRDIARLVSLVCECLDSAIIKNTSFNKKISELKQNIVAKKIEDSGNHKLLADFQKQLIEALVEVEDGMNSTSDNFKSNMTNVKKLEKKIKELESELLRTSIDNQMDYLTEVFTRRSFMNEARLVENNYINNNVSYGVVFFDIDYFKKINDTYGHDAGDVVLKTFAKILKIQTRDHDPICRYGGEEFVVLVHIKTKEELLIYLNRIKNIISQYCFVYEEHKIKLTFSAGVAVRDNYPSYEKAVKRADELLYKAKQKGRNKIILDSGKEI